MAHDEQGDLLQRLLALERQSERLQNELRQIKQELLSRATRVAEAPAAATPPPTPIAPVEEAPETPPPPPSEQPEPAAAAVAEKGERSYVDLEFWLGGRGLLLLGVAALVLAVSFVVKEAIARGWMGPTVRVLLGSGVGVLAVLAGERIRGLGYRIYGLWLAAGGFSAIYLSVWAAAVLYALVSAPLGFLLMVVVVTAAAVLGLLRGSESFVALAALGGYLAPLLVRVETASNLFGLGYLSLLSAAGFWVAYRGGWVYLGAVAVAGGTILSIAGAGDPHLHGVYLVALVAAALLVFRLRHWHYLSLLTVALGWTCFWIGSGRWDISGLTFAVYAAAIWLANLIASLEVTDWVSEEGRAKDDSGHPAADRPALRQESGALSRELTGLGLTLVPPWLFLLAAMAGIEDSVYRDSRAEIGFAIALVLGAAYVAQAVWGRPGTGAGSRLWRAALGCAFWLVAPAVLWDGVPVVRAWLLEGVAFTASGVLLRRPEARATGLAAFALAVLAYWGGVAGRPQADHAFVSGWALTGLAACLGFVAWSLALVRLERSESWETGIRPILLLAAVAFFLGWGTGEIVRFYDLLGEAERWALARDLSISAFWMGYAAALLAAGFWLKQAAVRWAGLGMAFIAATKVFVYDLSQLSQLYRIVSFVLLAIVLLALSFRYQRWRRT